MDTVLEQTIGRHYTGRCHCAGVKFELTGPVRPAIMCHCEDCFRISGYSWVALAVERSRFHLIQGEHMVEWYNSSSDAQRGFCRTCHAHMFYQRHNASSLSVGFGMIDAPEGIILSGQIFARSLKEQCVHITELPHLDETGWMPKTPPEPL